MTADMSKRRTSRSRGSAVLEFALSSTLLFMLFAGLADLTRMFYYARIVTNAARAGVQYGMYTSANWTNYTGMQSAATASAGNLTGLSAVATSYCQCPGTSGTVACASTCSGSTTPKEYVQVTTTYPFAAVVAWPKLPATFNISYTSIMPVQ
jgi:Flp pilus assembly protein TadG